MEFLVSGRIGSMEEEKEGEREEIVRILEWFGLLVKSLGFGA